MLIFNCKCREWGKARSVLFSQFIARFSQFYQRKTVLEYLFKYKLTFKRIPRGYINK